MWFWCLIRMPSSRPFVKLFQSRSTRWRSQGSPRTRWKEYISKVAQERQEIYGHRLRNLHWPSFSSLCPSPGDTEGEWDNRSDDSYAWNGTQSSQTWIKWAQNAQPIHKPMLHQVPTVSSVSAAFRVFCCIAINALKQSISLFLIARCKLVSSHVCGTLCRGATALWACADMKMPWWILGVKIRLCAHSLNSVRQ